ncbi:MAG: type II toxin-antitoxin system VapC family toxin [Verrucomicrobia bacterium]|nr:type II toxin-antitoxin system VapC family toxin [Verrucomicrobiota bacterium]
MILLDTHVVVWLASAPGQLSKAAGRILKQHPATLHISVVSAWEIALLVKRGRLELPLPPGEFISRAIRHHGLVELPLERRVAERAVALPDIHNDPFDRILVAECLERGGTLISRDTTLPRYPRLRVVW